MWEGFEREMSSPPRELPVRGNVLGRFVPILILLVLFLLVEFLYPRFPDIDDEFFKSAGRNLAAGDGFAAPELENFLQVDPPIQRVFFPHPPVYSWLFGQAVRLVGFDWKVCVGYDAVITALLSFCVYGLAGRLLEMLGIAEKRRGALALLPALCTLFLRQPARPDELAMLLSYANVWLLLARPFGIRIALLSGFLAGLTLCTSTGVLLGFLPLVAACWLLQVERARWPWLLAMSAAGAMTASAICLVPLYLNEPAFYRQFLQHVNAQVGKTPVWNRMRDALELTWQVAPWRAFGMIATLPLCYLGLLASWRVRPRADTVVLYAAPILGFLLLFYLRSAFTYWWFLQPWFMIVAVAVAAQRWRSGRRSLSGAWLACWLAAAMIWPAKGYCARLSLPPDQRIAQAEKRLRKMIPPRASVMTANAWWTLAGDHTLFDPNFSDIDDVERVDFFVADGNGTGMPGKWRAPDNPRYQQWLRSEFEIVHDDLPKEPVSVFGQRISRSAYGFGAIVMRRRTIDRSGENDRRVTPINR